MSGQRWKIYVCPDCGKRKGGAYFCRCHVPSSRCRAVEVAPISELVAAEQKAFDQHVMVGESHTEIERLRAALTQLQMGPDTLTQAGLKIVLIALHPDFSEQPGYTSPNEEALGRR